MIVDFDYYLININYHKWSKESPTREDTATTPSPTKSEKSEHLAPKLSSSTSEREEKDPDHPLTAANVDKDLMVLPNLDPTAIRVLPKKTSTSPDLTEVFFVEDVSSQES
jgi:hypothetical protein